MILIAFTLSLGAAAALIIGLGAVVSSEAPAGPAAAGRRGPDLRSDPRSRAGFEPRPNGERLRLALRRSALRRRFPALDAAVIPRKPVSP